MSIRRGKTSERSKMSNSSQNIIMSDTSEGVTSCKMSQGSKREQGEQAERERRDKRRRKREERVKGGLGKIITRSTWTCLQKRAG